MYFCCRNEFNLKLQKMKKLFVIVPALLFIFLLSSCDGPKKSGDQQTPDAETSASDQSANNPETDSDTKPMGISNTTENQPTDGVIGTEIVNNSAKRLTTKLGLAEGQTESVQGILMKNFLATGEKMDNVYTNEQYRIISKDIITKSSDAIIPMLNDSQKEMFNKFVNN